MLRGVDLVPDDLVGQLRVEETQVGVEHLAERCRGVDVERRAPAVEPQGRDQREEPVDVVAVEVREEDRTDLQRVDAVTDQLLLRPLAGIHEVVLLMDVDRLPRGVAARGGLGRGAAEYGYRKAHRDALLYLMKVALSSCEVVTSRVVVAVRVLLPSWFFSMCSVVV